MFRVMEKVTNWLLGGRLNEFADAVAGIGGMS